MYQEKNFSDWKIEINNKECDFRVVRVEKTTILEKYFQDQKFENKSSLFKTSVKIYHKRNDEENEDEEISDEEIFQEFKFDDYIIEAFCSGNFLIVELIDEVVKAVHCYNNSIHTVSLTHKKDFLPPCNHRIEIYNIYTKKKLSAMGIPLCKPYQFNLFTYSLFYVDPESIYLYNHKNNIYVALPYKNCSIIDAIEDDSDFFVAHLMPKVLKHYSKYSASSNITKSCIQKRINYPVPLYMLRLFLPFFYYFYYERTD